MQKHTLTKAFYLFIALFLPIMAMPAHAEDGYDLWLRYPAMNKAMADRYTVSQVVVTGASPTLNAARSELLRGLNAMLQRPIADGGPLRDGALIIGAANAPELQGLHLTPQGAEGYIIRTVVLNKRKVTVIAGGSDIGALYGAFRYLRLLQTHDTLTASGITDAPKVGHRIIDHWDNLNRTIERGYAGFSIWDWQKLPDFVDPQYTDYARAEASIGINGIVINNVNAQAEILTPAFLTKIAALANVLRPYGIRVYLTPRFSAPINIGGLKSADPLDPAVKAWWQAKTDEIYKVIPDFGGFLVKANSEGEPGPQDYGRNHADGANMLADALAPHGGIVMWRAFVYANDPKVDRVMQPVNEFKPLDGTFRDNVVIQIKNGPLDFQPREPFSPLFGALQKTHMALELQTTKEYLGFATHLVYLGTLFQETLQSDTYSGGKGSTVAKLISGPKGVIAGVSNIGTDRDWSGSSFNQANWYAFGRLAWNPQEPADVIAADWARQTFSTDPAFVRTTVKIMMASREAAVNYMTPMGLAHLMGTSHHYGPAPWVNDAGRADWNPVYYHRADADGIGVERTAKGTGAISQYAPEVAAQFADPATTDEKYLLWFHHVGWDTKMKSGRTLWQELVWHYDEGVRQVHQMHKDWQAMKPFVDGERYAKTDAYLAIQENEAQWWRDACVAYFRTFAKRPLPAGSPEPAHTLAYYQSLKFPYAPGIMH